jgi:hypothetical protein
VRVSVFALTSLSTSDWLLSSVNAMLINFPHYPPIDLDVNEEKWNQRLGSNQEGAVYKVPEAFRIILFTNRMGNRPVARTPIVIGDHVENVRLLAP